MISGYVDEVLVKFQARWVLREDGELEVVGAVATDDRRICCFLTMRLLVTWLTVLSS
jgi:hypothetical protein